MTPSQINHHWKAATEALHSNKFEEATALALPLAEVLKNEPEGIIAGTRCNFGMALGLLANIALNSEGSQAAIDVFAMGLDQIKSEPPGLLRAYLLLNEAMLFEHLRRPNDAVHLAIAAMRQSEAAATRGSEHAIVVILEGLAILDTHNAASTPAIASISAAYEQTKSRPTLPSHVERLRCALARDLSLTSRYQEALPHAEYVVALMAYRHGKESAEYGEALLDYGRVLDGLGDLQQAENNYRSAKRLLEYSLGNSHSLTRLARVNLAEVARMRGKLEEARDLFRAVQREDFETGAQTQRSHAQLLIGLGLTLCSLKDFTTADEVLNAALSIFEAVDGPESIACARVHLALGQLAQLNGLHEHAFGNLDKAEALYAAHGQKRALLHVQHQIDISRLYSSQFPEAATRLRKRLRGLAPGDDVDLPSIVAMQNEFIHHYTKCLLERGEIYRHSQQLLEDIELFDVLSGEFLVDQLGSIGAEALNGYLTRLRAIVDLYLSLVMGFYSSSPERIATVWRMSARLRSAETKALRLRARSSTQYDPSPTRSRMAALKSLLLRLSLRAQTAGLSDQQEADRQRYRDELSELEFSLASATSSTRLELEFLSGDAPPRISSAEVSCIFFSRYWSIEQRTIHVAAYTITGDDQRLKLADLGDEASLSALVLQFLASIREQGDRARPDISTLRVIGCALRRRIFDPLVDFLGSVRQLRVFSDGPAAMVPLAVLPTDDGGWLLDKYEIAYASEIRSVRGLQGPEDAGIDCLPVVIGAPAYSARDVQAHDVLDDPSLLALFRGGAQFSDLPNAQSECQSIAGLLGVRPFVGLEASEDTLRSLSSPEILHICTHGFYLAQSDALSQQAAIETPLGQRSLLTNSLDRAGLALSGANVATREAVHPAHGGDGLVFASEIADMDFMRTDLVTLSACKSALGDLQPGDGLHGLQRAFLTAGARTVVCSLWDVPDKPTKTLFEHFYSKILAGEPRGRALTLSMRELSADYPDHPIAWGGFILTGEQGPLLRYAKRLRVEFVRCSPEYESSGDARSVDSLLRDAQQLLASNDLVGVELMLSSALESDSIGCSDRARVLYSRAGARRSLGKFDAALDDYREIGTLKGVPKLLCISAMFDEGTTHLLSESWESALQCYNRVIGLDLDPDYLVMTLVNRAAALQELGRLDEAMADWSAVIENRNAPPNQRARARVSRAQYYLSLEHVEQALLEANNALQEADAPEETAMAWVTRGSVLEVMGDDAQATEAYLAIDGIDCSDSIRSIARARAAKLKTRSAL